MNNARVQNPFFFAPYQKRVVVFSHVTITVRNETITAHLAESQLQDISSAPLTSSCPSMHREPSNRRTLIRADVVKADPMFQ